MHFTDCRFGVNPAPSPRKAEVSALLSLRLVGKARQNGLRSLEQVMRRKICIVTSCHIAQAGTLRLISLIFLNALEMNWHGYFQIPPKSRAITTKHRF
jgi:hypothetical protein